LRDLVLPGGPPLVVPGCFDGLSAVLAEAAGFEAAYLTGFGLSASLLGAPDIGLLTQTEMAAAGQRVCAATSLPVIADADTGYGGPLDVARTVDLYERAGVAALQIEDQVAPKRCGHLAGKEVVPLDEAVTRMRAAVRARSEPSTVVVARTDAVATDGLEAAVDRALRFADAGADWLFVEAVTTVDDLATVGRRLEGVPLVLNWVDGGRTPAPDLATVAELGFAVVIAPVAGVLAAAGAVRERLEQLRQGLGESPAAMGFDELQRLLRLPERLAWADDAGSGT
jgi:2-methylisocitrate lyase-like PEP mutase family enzyme